MPMTIPYFVLQEKPLKPCSGLFSGFADHPEGGTVQDLLDYASTDLPADVHLDESYKPTVYTLLDPIPTFNLPPGMIAKQLGVIDTTFLDERAIKWPSNTPLSELGIKNEGNDGQVLVIFSSTHPRRPIESVPEDEPEYKPFSREEILRAAYRRDPPEIDAHNSKLLESQDGRRPDAMYNGRPYELTAPQIEIYHPVFANFRRKMAQPTEDLEFSATELELVHRLILNSLAFYDSKYERISELRVLRLLVHPQVFSSGVIQVSNGRIRRSNPDGAAYTNCKKITHMPVDDAAILFTEVKNGVGDGDTDPISQSQCDYITFYTSEQGQPLRDACCCPAFLIGIAGPYLTISGAVFADRFISQNLTDYLYLGGRPSIGPRIREIAKVLRVLKECLTDLEEYYSELAPTSSVPPPSRSVSQRRPPETSLPSKSQPSGKTSTSALFPHLKKFTHPTSGQDVELEYTERLMPKCPEKAVFKALARSSGSDVASTVVVKFTATYCREAHELLQNHLLAPQLWFCEIVESVGMYVVVMDFIATRQMGEAGLSADEASVLREALRILHDNDLVYGDLRNSNIILPKEEGKLPMLIDFDWSGRAGKATYPLDIDMDPHFGRHEDVCLGGLILREHDVFMLDQLVEQNSG